MSDSGRITEVSWLDSMWRPAILLPMPTVLMLLGWRFFFYSNEGNEPIHIHCQKGDAEAKYWLDAQAFEISETYAYGMSPGDRRTVRSIIFQHFDYIVSEWVRFQEHKND